MTGLPTDWATITVGEASGVGGLSADGDWIESKDQDPTGSVRLIQLQDIGDGMFVNKSSRFLTEDKAKELNCTFLSPGDVLIARMPDPLGRACRFPDIGQKSVTAVDVHVWRKGEHGVDPDFLVYCVNSPEIRQSLQAQASGTTRQRVSGGRLKAQEIPLPPLPEQRRIVRKLDTLSARSSTARTHLAAIEKLVERYKSGVLGLEISGVPLGNEIDQQNTQPITNDNERGAWTFDALPTHWVWTGFKTFLENQTDSYRKLPQKDYQSEGIYPVIDQGADLIGGYSNDANLLLPAEPPYIIFGDHTRCVKFFEAPFIQGADGVKVFHAGKDVDIRFAYWALKSLQLPDKGYSRHAKFLKESFFPRPPLEEQREIVRRIETAFAKIDRLAAEAAKALKLLGHLDQRILAKAFAGDLVPQDPTDEPAETLLARIREARAAAPKSRRGRK